MSNTTVDEVLCRAKKGHLRAKIDAKCCECIYDPMSDGSWRKQVEKCTSKLCPLFDVRPTSEYKDKFTGS